MNNGANISQRSLTIEVNDNTGTMHEALSLFGVELMMETLPSVISG